ncbi:MBL fold metallo-hydrolase [Syntrophotalea acetylenivorans]|uniref:MBL fold metallo-hydrolase n=1 Tax=Syntrophotalea acetylenivorans TaxID=1842532 RepID=A0A1L3GLR6_9BACT|nr:MBL fold metallo-hydrolase [Syntrophotalea acetylenivorans]APG26831.1 MBL fold metallo-hydrolase [Syntrophotalea acetylenivorans]
MRVCLLASGSKGNAILVESGGSRLLIDAGLSAREINRRLELVGVDGHSLDAVLVSHEHGDHCRGLGPMARRYKLPVFVHHKTRLALRNPGRLDDCREFDDGNTLVFQDVQIETVPLTHDAVAPVGYLVDTPAGKVGVLTDLGMTTRLVVERYRHCRVLILEFNHDQQMLMEGPYPWHLKQRIRSNHGHLSNESAAGLLSDLVWDGLEGVFLAHLSDTNNCPQLAEVSARQVLSAQNSCNPQVMIGTQAQPSSCFVAE